MRHCPDCDAEMNLVKRNGKPLEPLRYVCSCGHIEKEKKMINFGGAPMTEL